MKEVPRNGPGEGLEFRASRRGPLLVREDSWLRKRARRWIGNRELEVSDLVQDVRLRALRQSGDLVFPSRGVFRRWLDRILGNRVREIVRRRRPVSTDLEAFGNVADLALTPARRAAESDRDRRIQDVLASLPERQRRVLELRLWERLEFSEVGQRLGISANYARVTFHRAVERIRDRFGAEL